MKKIMILILAVCCFISLLTGCKKDEIIDHYNEALQEFDNSLTKDKELQGSRSFGSDSYVGSYSADYEGLTGTEILFGGTALERDDGNEIEVTCKLNITGGTAKLVFRSGADDPRVLIESTGDYSETIELPSASNYLAVEGDEFTGSIELDIITGGLES